MSTHYILRASLKSAQGFMRNFANGTNKHTHTHHRHTQGNTVFTLILPLAVVENKQSLILFCT